MSAVQPVLTLPPAVTLHIATALLAVALGPFALWARKGSRLHRAAGYAWVTAMLATAVSSLFIRDYSMPNLAGYTPIHVLTAATFAGLGYGIVAVMQGRITAHQRAMRQLYVGACLIAGAFTLLPSRYLGGLLWGDVLGWI